MNQPYQVERPQYRSKLRKWAGKEYFVFKRKMEWWLGKEKFAKVRNGFISANRLIAHQSFLLRPLKDVDMQLQHNKVTNLKLAIKHIHQVVIEPGETFSIWQLVGRPTSLKGYLEGMTLHNGKVERGIGGGLCQLGNLMYWMALHSPLTITERWRHGYDVFPDLNRKIPFACGATLSYNYIDLQLRNDTEKKFQFLLWLDDTHLHGELHCDEAVELQYEIFETDHCFRQQWWGGYTRHDKIWKRITHLQTGDIREELVAENNAIMMYEPLIGNSSSKP